MNPEKKRPTFAILLYFIVFIFFINAEDSVAVEPKGPLYQSNRYPLMLIVMTPVPRSPILHDSKFHVALRGDYTSIHIDKSSKNFELLTDMEAGVLTVEGSVRIGERAGIRATIPFASYNSGFLDGFLEKYHDFGNFPDYGRSRRPKNEFACIVKKNGQTWFETSRSGLNMTDITFDAMYSLHSGERSASAVMASIKLPSGNEKKGFGSGKYDFGLTLLSRFTFRNMAFYLNPGVIIPEDPKTKEADIHFRTMATLFLGIEYIYSPKWSYIAQLNTFTSPLENTGIDTLDDPSIELALGFVRSWSRTRLSFTFCEDLSGPAPDFTVHLGISTNL